jgi:hypothetical protein
MTGQTKFNGHEWPHLGPYTEARFAETFSRGATANAIDAAGLLGIDVDTLNAMTDEGIVRAVRRGTRRSWTEADLRNYLLTCPDAEKKKRKPDPKGPTTGGRVVPFSRRRRP